MSWQRALNEVQGLLTQGGVPTNHSQDIVARFAAAMSDYYDFRENSKSQEVTSDSASSSAFQNAFRSPEEYPGGTPGAAGAAGAGAYAWAAGKDGKDGIDGDGSSDNYNTFNDYRNTVVGGGGGLNIGSVNCMDLKAKLQSCGIETGSDCDCKEMECGGMLAGKSLCQVVENQARELRRIRERLDAIEKQLKDTVDC